MTLNGVMAVYFAEFGSFLGPIT